MNRSKKAPPVSEALEQQKKLMRGQPDAKGNAFCMKKSQYTTQSEFMFDIWGRLTPLNNFSIA